jgi:phycocyanin beta chain
MLDAFTKVVAQADARGAFVGDAQIDALKTMVADGSKRIDVVNRITSNSSTIVANAAEMLTPTDGWLLACATWKLYCAM